MVPDTFTNYFLASVGASAALIGLLFVAVAVAPERVFGSESTLERRTMAGGAFLALVNAFFVSLAALIPKANVGYTALVISIFALINTFRLGQHIWTEWRLSRNAEGLLLVLSSVVIYGDEIRYAVPLLQRGRDSDALYGLAYLLLASYGLAVARAWALLGGGQDGLLALLGFRGKRREDHPAPPAGAGQPAPTSERSQANEPSLPH
jgi:hypothetical protein